MLLVVLDSGFRRNDVEVFSTGCDKPAVIPAKAGIQSSNCGRLSVPSPHTAQIWYARPDVIAPVSAKAT